MASKKYKIAPHMSYFLDANLMSKLTYLFGICNLYCRQTTFLVSIISGLHRKFNCVATLCRAVIKATRSQTKYWRSRGWNIIYLRDAIISLRKSCYPNSLINKYKRRAPLSPVVYRMSEQKYKKISHRGFVCVIIWKIRNETRLAIQYAGFICRIAIRTDKIFVSELISIPSDCRERSRARKRSYSPIRRNSCCSGWRERSKSMSYIQARTGKRATGSTWECSQYSKVSTKYWLPRPMLCQSPSLAGLARRVFDGQSNLFPCFPERLLIESRCSFRKRKIAADTTLNLPCSRDITRLRDELKYVIANAINLFEKNRLRLQKESGRYFIINKIFYSL